MTCMSIAAECSALQQHMSTKGETLYISCIYDRPLFRGLRSFQGFLPVLQSGSSRGPGDPALGLICIRDARTGASCMKSFGSLLILIWGKTNREC
jgi:hypothetical protein